MAQKKLNLYSYNDYRRYLADYFEYRRARMEQCSLRSFAQKAGLSSHSFISAVIKGKRNLTAECKQKMGLGLGLDRRELEFFLLLVDFNQQRDPDEKQAIFERLNEVRRQTTYYKLNKAHFDYLSKWYYLVIRELAVCVPWRDDFRYLGSLTLPPISESEAKAAVKTLCAIGILRRNDDGSYNQADRLLTTQDIPGHLVRNVRKQFIALSARASEEIDPHARNLGSATVTLSRKNFAKAVDIVEEARKRIIALSQDDEPVHRVYQAHLHLFPLSGEIDVGEGT
jgi:uncharacterized protein (TIGR02147 family)